MVGAVARGVVSPRAVRSRPPVTFLHVGIAPDPGGSNRPNRSKAVDLDSGTLVAKCVTLRCCPLSGRAAARCRSTATRTWAAATARPRCTPPVPRRARRMCTTRRHHCSLAGRLVDEIG